MKDHFHATISCDHLFQRCSICDIVFCTKCGKEWVAQLSWFFPYTVTYTTVNTDGKVKHHQHE
jgi:hypothetical protein